jgi:hypothetical protein
VTMPASAACRRSAYRWFRSDLSRGPETTLRLLAECPEELGAVPAVVLSDRMAFLRAGVVSLRPRCPGGDRWRQPPRRPAYCPSGREPASAGPSRLTVSASGPCRCGRQAAPMDPLARSHLQRLFPMLAAPAVFFPLGAVILDSRVLPPVLGYLSLVLGAAFAVSGVVYLFAPILTVVVALSIIQGVWFLAAAITLLASSSRSSDSEASAGASIA